MQVPSFEIVHVHLMMTLRHYCVACRKKNDNFNFDSLRANLQSTKLKLTAKFFWSTVVFVHVELSMIWYS